MELSAAQPTSEDFAFLRIVHIREYIVAKLINYKKYSLRSQNCLVRLGGF